MAENDEPLELVEDEESFSLDDLLDSEELDVKPISLDEDHMIILKKDITPFLRFCVLHSKTGNDVYTRAFRLSRTKSDKIELLYSNGSYYGKKEIKTIVNENQLLGSFVFELSSFVKSITPTCGQLPIVKNDDKVFGHLFGGKLFIQTYNISESIYQEPQLGTLEEEVKLNIIQFTSLLKSLLTLSVSGSRAEERAVYFEKDSAYVYSGPVIGKFPGSYLPMSLQNLDVQSILTFFESSKEDITIQLYPNYIKFKSGDDYLIAHKKTLVLASNIKEMSFEVKDGITIDPTLLHKVISVLIDSPSGSGVATIQNAEYGIDVVSSTRVGDTNSKFPLYGTKEGGGLSKDNVKISLKVLKSYLSAFASQVVLDIREDKLYIRGDIGKVIINGIGS